MLIPTGETGFNILPRVCGHLRAMFAGPRTSWTRVKSDADGLHTRRIGTALCEPSSTRGNGVRNAYAKLRTHQSINGGTLSTHKLVFISCLLAATIVPVTSAAAEDSGPYATAYLTSAEVTRTTGAEPYEGRTNDIGCYDSGSSRKCSIGYAYTPSNPKTMLVSTAIETGSSAAEVKRNFQYARQTPPTTSTKGAKIKLLKKDTSTLAWIYYQTPKEQSRTTVSRISGKTKVTAECTLGSGAAASYACASKVVNAQMAKLKAKGLLK